MTIDMKLLDFNEKLHCKSEKMCIIYIIIWYSSINDIFNSLFNQSLTCNLHFWKTSVANEYLVPTLLLFWNQKIWSALMFTEYNELQQLFANAENKLLPRNVYNSTSTSWVNFFFQFIFVWKFSLKLKKPCHFHAI